MNSGREYELSQLFCVRDLGLALAATTCPHRTQPFKKVNNGQTFPSGEIICHVLSGRTGSRYAKARL